MAMNVVLLPQRQSPKGMSLTWGAMEGVAHHLIFVGSRKLSPEELEAAGLLGGTDDCIVAKVGSEVTSVVDDVSPQGEARYYGVAMVFSDGAVRSARFRAVPDAGTAESLSLSSRLKGGGAKAAAPAARPAAAAPAARPAAAAPSGNTGQMRAVAPAAPAARPVAAPAAAPAPRPAAAAPAASEEDPLEARKRAQREARARMEAERSGGAAPAAAAAREEPAEEAPASRAAPAAEPAAEEDPMEARKRAQAAARERAAAAAGGGAAPAASAASSDEDPMEARKRAQAAARAAREGGGAGGAGGAGGGDAPGSAEPVKQPNEVPLEESFEARMQGGTQTWDGLRIYWERAGGTAAYEIIVSDHQIFGDELGDALAGKADFTSAVAVAASTTVMIDNITPRESRGWYLVLARARDGKRTPHPFKVGDAAESQRPVAGFVNPNRTGELRAEVEDLLGQARENWDRWKSEQDRGSQREAKRLVGDAMLIFPNYPAAKALLDEMG